MSSPEGALIRVTVTTVSDPAGHDRQLPRNGFAVQQRCGADSVREVRPVPVGRVGQDVGLAERWDENLHDFNMLQVVANPTPSSPQVTLSSVAGRE